MQVLLIEIFCCFITLSLVITVRLNTILYYTRQSYNFHSLYVTRSIKSENQNSQSRLQISFFELCFPCISVLVALRDGPKQLHYYDVNAYVISLHSNRIRSSVGKLSPGTT